MGLKLKGNSGGSAGGKDAEGVVLSVVITGLSLLEGLSLICEGGDICSTRSDEEAVFGLEKECWSSKMVAIPQK